MNTSGASASSSYFVQLDSFRCLAVVLVLLAHWTQAQWLLDLRLANFGIDLFFVLSSFLITRILLQNKESIASGKSSLGQQLKTFYLRRTLRIFPLYYAVLLITYAFNDGVVRESFPWNAAYLSNFYIMQRGEWPGIVSHFWSLAVEEQFYLIWPLAILLTPRTWLKRMMIGVILLSVGLRIGLYFSGASLITLKVFTPICFDAFGIGALLAFAAKYDTSRLNAWLHPRVGWGSCAAFVALSASTYVWGWANPAAVIGLRLVGSLFSAWLLGKAYEGIDGFWQPVVEWRPFLFIGQISYAIYLFHNFVPGFFLGVSWPENEWARVPMYLFGVIVVSYAARLLIEQPFNRLKRHVPYG
ncbi:MAG: acyltransferase [Bacteroidota bacterium]